MMNEVAHIKKILELPKNITIIAHRNPDGDALGSSLALKMYLEKNKHSVHVVMPSESPVLFNYLPGFDTIEVFDLRPNQAREKVENAEVIFCLDFNALDRIDKLGTSVLEGMEQNAKTIVIDHHIDPEPFADYIISDTNASSTCELVHRFITAMGDRDMIDWHIGEAIYTGLITDTGSFKYNTNPELFRIAAHLKEIQVDDDKLQNIIFNSMSYKQLRLLGHCLARRMDYMEEYGVGIITLNKKDYIDYDIQRGDTEGIVNYLLKVKNIDVAAFITKQPQIVKISMRSKGDISVQEICSNHFNGGGHKNASGGALYTSLSNAIRIFKELIPQYIKKKEL